MKTLLLPALLISSISHAAIFGNDDRTLLQPNSPVQSLARATAIAVIKSNIEQAPGGKINLLTDVLEQMCSNEKHVQGPSLSYSCTGFLVGPDLLATAGHCVYAVNTPTQTLRNETGLACSTFNWLFDYQADMTGKLKTKSIDPSLMYKCKRIIFAANREGKPFDDYALIQLDRPVVGRTPFKVNTNAAALNGELRTIGFPFGTAMKLSSKGKVVHNNTARQSFITTLDVFEGNSGSPVINARNEIVGILVGGTPSLNTYSDGQCERQNRCDEQRQNCKYPDKDTSKFPGFQAVGSEVQRILPIAQLMQKKR